MKLERNILKPFFRTAICIISILFISIGFSFGGALAGNCQGGPDCLVCAELPHGHVPGAGKGMANPGCPPGVQNSTCGFEASQNPDEFQGIASSFRSYNQVNIRIFTAASCGYLSLLSGEFVSQCLLFDSNGAAPIFLQNQSLLF
jgi:hypothetical protein